MNLLEKMAIGVILPLLWNVLTVVYYIYHLRRQTLTPLKFTIVFTLGYGGIISLMLFWVMVRGYGINLRTIGIPLIILLLHGIIFFPVIYWVSKNWLPNIQNYFNKVKIIRDKEK